MMAGLPQDAVCHGPRTLTRAELLARASVLASRLPASERIVNLCESRAHFLITFMACALRHRPQLLPGVRTPQALAELAQRFGGTESINDVDVARLAPEGAVPAADIRHDWPPRPEALVLTGFTSGSTGTAQPHDKTWQALQGSYGCNGAAIRAALGLGEAEPVSLLGTVPVHHMYGVELTVLLPLFGGMSVHDHRPLFPADVATCLDSLPSPRVLVSTPLHLRAMADSDLEFPEVSLLISASAPLEASLATRIEQRLGAPLLEMFGSTETCVFATRRTSVDSEWSIYPGVRLQPGSDGTRVSAPWYAADQQLQDIVELRDGNRFLLRGRNSDLVEVAGKRASLADITRRLCAIPGVKDAAVFQPEATAGVANRLAAVVVSPVLNERQILDALAAGLDAVFLPRPLVLVEAIPRDALGKAARERLMALLPAR